MPDTEPAARRRRTLARGDHGTPLIDGRPALILSADVPYARLPPGRWADTIARTRRGGMNAVGVNVAWDVHEPTPGRFDFAGGRDLDAFLAECARQGMYAIVRPNLAGGPAPHPDAPPGRRLDALAPIVARHLWTRGGSVILAEEAAEGGREYVRDGLIRRGVDVPVSVAAGGEEVREEDAGGGIGYAMLRALARGERGCRARGYLTAGEGAALDEAGRPTDAWYAARRIALWAHTFRDILVGGEHRQDLPATGGLRVSELRTAERGGILFVDNPDPQRTVTGSVFPYLPELTLAPRTLLPWVHDVPLGGASGGRYLSAYAGLVKSDAPVLAAHVLPDPQEGVRVYVYGAPGARAEVVLWNGGERARGVDVEFADGAPRVYAAGPSQIVALPTALAGRTWIDPADPDAPVVIGPDDVYDHGAGGVVVEAAPGRTHTIHVLRSDGGLSPRSFAAPAGDGRAPAVVCRVAL